jgi:hypothetical protein
MDRALDCTEHRDGDILRLQTDIFRLQTRTNTKDQDNLPRRLCRSYVRTVEADAKSGDIASRQVVAAWVNTRLWQTIGGG